MHEKWNLLDGRCGRWLWLVMVLMLLVLVACSTQPPGTLTPIVITETPSATLTEEPEDTNTPEPTEAPEETNTPEPPILPTETPEPTATETPTPTTDPYTGFFENFEFFDSAVWHLDVGSGDSSVVNGAMNLTSSGRRYPYLYTQFSPFPSQGDFSATFRFRYPRVRDCGVGVIMGGHLVPAGLGQAETAGQLQQAESQGVLIGVWQDRASGMQIWFRSGAERADLPYAINNEWHEMTVEYQDNQYSIVFDDALVYTSDPTSFRPNVLWLGHPADLGSSCAWSALEVDTIKIERIP